MNKIDINEQYTRRIKRLILDLLSPEERRELISEIKSSEELKFQYLIQKKVMEDTMIEQQISGAANNRSSGLDGLRTAAFASIDTDGVGVDLPVTDKTIIEFLIDDEDDDEKDEEDD